MIPWNLGFGFQLYTHVDGAGVWIWQAFSMAVANAKEVQSSRVRLNYFGLFKVTSLRIRSHGKILVNHHEKTPFLGEYQLPASSSLGAV